MNNHIFKNYQISNDDPFLNQKDNEASILWQRLSEYSTIEEEEQLLWEVRQ